MLPLGPINEKHPQPDFFIRLRVQRYAHKFDNSLVFS